MSGPRLVYIGSDALLDDLYMRSLDYRPPRSARKPNADEQVGDHGDDEDDTLP